MSSADSMVKPASLDQRCQLRARQHPHMGGIAQDFDGVLQFGLGRHLGRDHVGDDKTAAGPDRRGIFPTSRGRAGRNDAPTAASPRHRSCTVRKRQLGGIAFAESDIVEPGRGAALRGLRQHLRREIERHHLAGGLCDRGTEMPGPQATSSTDPAAPPRPAPRQIRCVSAVSVIAGRPKMFPPAG